MHTTETKPKAKTQTIRGVEYIYQEFSYRVPGGKHPKHRRNYLGKMIDGTFVPNAKFLLLSPEEQTQTGLIFHNTAEGPHAKRGRRPASEVSTRLFYGAAYLFDHLAERLRVTGDLKQVFPYTWEKILSLAWFLILEDHNVISRFSKWGKTHKHPYGKDITSPRSSELFGTITEDGIQQFFSCQIKRRLEKEYLAYDCTSISTYYQALAIARRGKNKEHDQLEQINLALVFGHESMLPVCYRILPGNITDVMTVKKTVRDLAAMGIGSVSLVMDQGFYSEENITALYKQHYRFVIAAKKSLKRVKAAIDRIRDTMVSFERYHEGQDIYYASELLKWETKGTDAEGKEITQAHKRMYLHLYYDDQRALNARKSQHKKVLQLKRELEQGERKTAHEQLYTKYFTIKKTPKRGMSVIIRTEVLKEEAKYYGYFSLMSNLVKDPIDALIVYRAKDVVEKAFGNLKERLALRRPGVSTHANLQGKIFVQYIALIILSQIQKTMREQKLYQGYTLYTLLDELDVIEYFTHAGKRGHWGEVAKKQAKLFQAFKVPSPVHIK